MSITVFQGTTVRLNVAFTNISGAATDPTTVSLKVKAPGTALATYTYAGGTLTRSSTGVYYKDISTTTTGGLYRYYWTGTGTAAAAGYGEFFATPVPF